MMVISRCQTTVDGRHVMYPSQRVRAGGIPVAVGVVECSGVCSSAVVVGGCDGADSSGCSGDCSCDDGASVRGVAAVAGVVRGVAESAGAPSCSC